MNSLPFSSLGYKYGRLSSRVICWETGAAGIKADAVAFRFPQYTFYSKRAHTHTETRTHIHTHTPVWSRASASNLSFPSSARVCIFKWIRRVKRKKKRVLRRPLLWGWPKPASYSPTTPITLPPPSAPAGRENWMEETSWSELCPLLLAIFKVWFAHQSPKGCFTLFSYLF